MYLYLIDYSGLFCSITSVRICIVLYIYICFVLFFHLHSCTILKNMLLIPFIRFGAHTPNGFLATFVIHYLSAVMVIEWTYCLVMIYQPLCTPWMHVIVMCDNKGILNFEFEFEKTDPFPTCLGLGNCISTTFYNGCYKLPMLGFKLIHISERDPRQIANNRLHKMIRYCGH